MTLMHRFIDTHCHLNFIAFDHDIPDIVRHSEESGVEEIVIPGTDLTSSTKAIEISTQYPHCFAAVGIHPHHARDPQLIINDSLLQKLEALTSHPKVVAIGEIGIDYHTYQSTKYSDTGVTDELKAKQKELLLLQLGLAKKHSLPPILHCREAFDDLITLVAQFSKDSLWKPEGVLHCFTGSKKHLRAILELGFFVGFDGNITYDQSLEQVVSDAPLERILIETDSPYLTPVPLRGTRNEPKNISLIAEKIAQIKHISIDEVALHTSLNARAVFHLPQR